MRYIYFANVFFFLILNLQTIFSYFSYFSVYTHIYSHTHVYGYKCTYVCDAGHGIFRKRKNIYVYIYIQKIINNFSIALCPICVFIEGYKFLEFFKIRLFPIISYHGLHHQLRFLEIIIT